MALSLPGHNLSWNVGIFIFASVLETEMAPSSTLFFPQLGERESREGDGPPLQYSCLGNPMDGGAWWAAVHGVAKSRT